MISGISEDPNPRMSTLRDAAPIPVIEVKEKERPLTPPPVTPHEILWHTINQYINTMTLVLEDFYVQVGDLFTESVLAVMVTSSKAVTDQVAKLRKTVNTLSSAHQPLDDAGAAPDGQPPQGNNGSPGGAKKGAAPGSSAASSSPSVKRLRRASEKKDKLADLLKITQQDSRERRDELQASAEGVNDLLEQLRQATTLTRKNTNSTIFSDPTPKAICFSEEIEQLSNALFAARNVIYEQKEEITVLKGLVRDIPDQHKGNQTKVTLTVCETVQVRLSCAGLEPDDAAERGSTTGSVASKTPSRKSTTAATAGGGVKKNSSATNRADDQGSVFGSATVSVAGSTRQSGSIRRQGSTLFQATAASSNRTSRFVDSSDTVRLTSAALARRGSAAPILPSDAGTGRSPGQRSLGQPRGSKGPADFQSMKSSATVAGANRSGSAETTLNASPNEKQAKKGAGPGKVTSLEMNHAGMTVTMESIETAVERLETTLVVVLRQLARTTVNGLLSELQGRALREELFAHKAFISHGGTSSYTNSQSGDMGYLVSPHRDSLLSPVGMESNKNVGFDLGGSSGGMSGTAILRTMIEDLEGKLGRADLRMAKLGAYARAQHEIAMEAEKRQAKAYDQLFVWMHKHAQGEVPVPSAIAWEK